MAAISVQVSAEAWIPQYYNSRFPGTDIVGGCEPLGEGAGNRIWVICKSSKHS